MFLLTKLRFTKETERKDVKRKLRIKDRNESVRNKDGQKMEENKKDVIK